MYLLAIGDQVDGNRILRAETRVVHAGGIQKRFDMEMAVPNQDWNTYVYDHGHLLQSHTAIDVGNIVIVVALLEDDGEMGDGREQRAMNEMNQRIVTMSADQVYQEAHRVGFSNLDKNPTEAASLMLTYWMTEKFAALREDDLLGVVQRLHVSDVNAIPQPLGGGETTLTFDDRNGDGGYYTVHFRFANEKRPFQNNEYFTD